MPVITPHQTAPAGADGHRAADPIDDRIDDGAVGPPARPAAAASTAPGPRRRRWPFALAAVVVLAVVGATIVVLSDRDDGSAADGDLAAGAVREVRTAEVEQRDLAELDEVDGILSYGDGTQVAAAANGTLTDVVTTGADVDRGDALYRVDAAPTIVFWGSSPIYRTLEDGVDDGGDVRVLEENLMALGHDADGELVVDDTFDDATTAAVEAWQQELGVDDTGSVEPDDVIVLLGPAVVDTVDAEIGSTVSTGTPILTVNVTDVATTVFAPTDGRITLAPSPGASYATGDVAYEVDTVPIPVIVGDVAFDRRLIVDIDDGDDVEQLEAALAGLGFDAGGELVVDETYDQATAQATADWFESLGIDPGYGQIDIGRVAVLPVDARVLSVAVERGDDVSAGSAVFTAGVSRRELSGQIASADADLIAVGDAVTVEFPDATVVDGTITSIDPTSTTDPATGDTTIGFDVAIAEIPDSALDRNSIDVTINITRELVEGATVVPASALVSVGDGTYAVEVIDGTTTRFVAVEPGLFADGYVEVAGIDPGTQVVVPS